MALCKILLSLDQAVFTHDRISDIGQNIWAMEEVGFYSKVFRKVWHLLGKVMKGKLI